MYEKALKYVQIYYVQYAKHNTMTNCKNLIKEKYVFSLNRRDK